MTFVAGPYTAAWNSQTIGVTEEGYELGLQEFEEPIRGDNMGDTIQDHVYRGHGLTIEFVLEEFDSSAMALILWPFHATFGTHGQAGVLGTSKAKALVLTAVAGTTAATRPATLTASLAILEPGFLAKYRFQSRLRKVPIRLRVYPNSSGIFFSTT